MKPRTATDPATTSGAIAGKISSRAGRAGPVLATALAALLASSLFLPACLTCQLWDAQREQRLVALPPQKSGDPAPRAEREFVNNFAGLFLAPFAIVADILLFPFQLIGGYHPYGPRTWEG